MRDSTGQSTLEYVALVLLALAVLAAGGLAVSATGIADAVVAQIVRGLCLIGGGRCTRSAEPCILASRTTADDVGVRLAFVRLGGGRTLIRERRSDGTEVVTLVARGGAGLEASIGAEVRIGDRAAGGSLGGSVEGRLGHGRVWRVASARAGDELIRRLASQTPTAGRIGLVRARAPRLPAPDVTYGEHGIDTAVRAALGAVGIELDTEDALGSRADRRTGERTFLIRRRNELLGTVGLGAGLGAGARAALRRDERYALTTDRDGRPLDLAVTESLRAQAGLSLPRPLRALVGTHLPALRRGRVVQIERHLDLTDATNLAAAGAFVRALRRPRLRLGDAVAVSHGLLARLDLAGSAQMRVYAYDARHTGGHAVLSVGAGLGGGAERLVETLRLERAAERDPGGAWHVSGTCRPLRTGRA